MVWIRKDATEGVKATALGTPRSWEPLIDRYPAWEESTEFAAALLDPTGEIGPGWAPTLGIRIIPRKRRRVIELDPWSVVMKRHSKWMRRARAGFYSGGRELDYIAFLRCTQ